MKQTLSLLLVWALLCSCFLLPAGAEETDSPTLGELVAQLKAEGTIRELWVPILPEGYEITHIKISDVSEGSYGYFVRQSDQATVAFSAVCFADTANTDPRFSPSGALMAQNGLSARLFDREGWEPITKGDSVRYKSPDGTASSTYTYDGYAYQGQYSRWPIVYTGWTVSNRRLGDISSSDCHEVTLSLSRSTVASIAFQYRSTPDVSSVEETITFLPNYLSLSFTTLGDADTDGQVDAADALAILKHSVGKGEITDELAFLMADTDDNGTLDAADALTALRIAVGK